MCLALWPPESIHAHASAGADKLTACCFQCGMGLMQGRRLKQEDVVEASIIRSCPDEAPDACKLDDALPADACGLCKEVFFAAVFDGALRGRQAENEREGKGGRAGGREGGAGGRERIDLTGLPSFVATFALAGSANTRSKTPVSTCVFVFVFACACMHTYVSVRAYVCARGGEKGGSGSQSIRVLENASQRQPYSRQGCRV